MPDYANDDLISLTSPASESSMVASSASASKKMANDDLINLTGPASESSIVARSASTSKKIANEHKSVRQDSFSGLTVLMKAKKPYAPITPPSSKLPLSVATNGMQSASRVASGSSIVSPLARPYHIDGSVAAYLQDQACSSTSEAVSPASEYRQDNMRRLESIMEKLQNFPIGDDDSVTVHPHAHAAPVPTAESVPPGFCLPVALPIHAGPISPPTPAESTRPLITEEPMVRVTMRTWDAMRRSLEVFKDEKRELEIKIARLEKQKVNHRMEQYNDEMETQIGKLQYQNELNKTQKATMARTLSEKGIQIKELQLEINNLKESLETMTSAIEAHTDIAAQLEYRQATLKEDEISSSRRLADLTDVKNREIETLLKKVDDLQEALRLSEIDRDAAINSNGFKNLAQNRLDQLSQREKLLRSTQERYAAEHTKVGELEDHLEDLQRKLNQVGDLQAMLREKSSECDRYRTQLKIQEKRVEDYKHRTLRASNDGAALRGAAHLVKPQANTRFSTLVLGCSECYAKNISCDNKARCRSCTENNENCARWRCSLHHILGQCPDTPCRFPHDEQGWLCQVEPRPQW